MSGDTDLSAARTGIYPGTFDPVTNGHLDIIARATRVVDRLIIGVAVNAGKGPLFTLEERVAMVTAEIDYLETNGGAEIEVRAFEGLLTNFAIEAGAGFIIRGLRAVSDFEYEFQMTGMNARLAPKVETVFLMASETNQFISSHLVKEICSMGGEVGAFVTSRVEKRMGEKFTAS